MSIDWFDILKIPALFLLVIVIYLVGHAMWAKLFTDKRKEQY